jgi:hypothetical protein
LSPEQANFRQSVSFRYFPFRFQISVTRTVAATIARSRPLARRIALPFIVVEEDIGGRGIMADEPEVKDAMCSVLTDEVTVAPPNQPL